MDISIQKGQVAGIPGCLEHTKETKEKTGNLVIPQTNKGKATQIPRSS